MKQFLLKPVCSSIILSALFACSNELPVEQGDLASTFDTKAEAQLEKVVILDDVVKFKDGGALCEAMLEPKIVSTAIFNSNNTSFKSLGSKYVELERSYDLMVVNKEVEGRELSVDDDVIENRVRSRIFADFLNEDGMMIVGDSAVKVIGDYAYSSSISEYNKLLQMAENELRSHKNVNVHRIIEPLISDDSAIQTRGSSGGTYERSYVFYLNNNKRREFVVFNPFLFVVPNAQTEIVIEMEGKGQKKQLFGWLATFSDEMVWAEIHLDSGSWHYNQPPLGGYPTPQGTNYFTTGLMAQSANDEFCRWAKILGNSAGVSNVKASITYKMKKSDNQPSGWKDTYTNNYTSITK